MAVLVYCSVFVVSLVKYNVKNGNSIFFIIIILPEMKAAHSVYQVPALAVNDERQPKNQC